MIGPRLAQGGGQTRGAQEKSKQATGTREAEAFERLSYRMQNEDAAMWRDYRIFKVVGLLHEWRRLYRARIPAHFLHRDT